MTRPDGRPVHRFRRIVVIGGGCYGTWYVRQLGRAWRAGALVADEVLVVNRRSECSAAQECASLADSGFPVSLVADQWAPFLARWMVEGAEALARDAMVPSPMMPHLCLDWLCELARTRWGDPSVAVAPLTYPLAVPWQRTAPDGRHYVSHADWTCPVNCIEPRRCPATRGERTWSMPETVRSYVATLASAASDGMADGIDRACIFPCTHRTHGVGMIDMAPLAAAGAALRAADTVPPLRWLVGTTSHCHGALGLLSVTVP